MPVRAMLIPPLHRVYAEEGFSLEQKTRTHQMKIKSKATRLRQEYINPVIELPHRKQSICQRFLKLDSLVRNLVVAGGLALVVIAIRNSTMTQAQSVFSALQDSVGIQWDESIGKLSFVNTLLPEGVQEVWSESNKRETNITTPIRGNIVHAWSVNEPFFLIQTDSERVFAVGEGEISAIAHGINDERIIRITHSDSSESIYGNLANTVVDVGDCVSPGDELGTLLAGQPLAYEFRRNGFSVNDVGIETSTSE